MGWIGTAKTLSVRDSQPLSDQPAHLRVFLWAKFQAGAVNPDLLSDYASTGFKRRDWQT